jgi:hypothetical protein
VWSINSEFLSLRVIAGNVFIHAQKSHNSFHKQLCVVEWTWRDQGTQTSFIEDQASTDVTQFTFLTTATLYPTHVTWVPHKSQEISLIRKNGSIKKWFFSSLHNFFPWQHHVLSIPGQHTLFSKAVFHANPHLKDRIEEAASLKSKFLFKAKHMQALKDVCAGLIKMWRITWKGSRKERTGSIKRRLADSARLLESEGQWRHFAFRFFVVFLFNFWQACSIYFSPLWGRERVGGVGRIALPFTYHYTKFPFSCIFFL